MIISGEQESLKVSLGEYDNRLLPCKEGDVTSSGEQDSLKVYPGEYDTRLLPCKEGDVTNSLGEYGSLRNSRGEGATVSQL